MKSLLKQALTQFDTLRDFYVAMQTSVKDISLKGQEENRIGFIINMYFGTLIINDLQLSEKTQEMLEMISKEYVDIMGVDKEKERIAYRVKPEKREELGRGFNVQKSAEKYSKYSDMPEIHSVNTLIGLITKFEEAISNYLYSLFSIFPDCIRDKQISFGEISGKTSEEIKNYIIKREVERIMWQPQNEWFKIFSGRKICFDTCRKQLDTLNEIYARRNVWVHNSGYVNEIYLNSIKKSKEKIGTLLKVDQDYLFNAFVCIKSILYTLYIESAKFQEKNKDLYLYDIFKFAFDELVKKDYPLCVIVFPEICKCKFADERTKNMAMVNYWIAQKALGKFASIKKEVESFDTSALNEQFELAKLILLEKNDEAAELIENIYDVKITSKELSQWPLFKEFRKTEQYRKLRNNHLADFEIEEIEKNDVEENELAVENIKDEMENNQY